MAAFVISLTWLCLAVGLLSVLLNQLRKYEVLRPGIGLGEREAPRLAVIVPARNESATIERCLSGLLAQTYPSDKLSIVVVNDHSTDDTGAIVRRIAETHPALRLIEADPLPGGWLGKAHACWQAAQATDGAWLCFIDADTASEPELLRTAVSFAEARGIDLLSLQPFQELGTFWERLVMPARLILAAIVVSIPRVNDPGSPNAAANGQFILIRRPVYEAVGGHAAVRAEFLEDIALARLVKRSGCRIYLMSGRDLIRTRMYTHLATLWRGQTKNAVDIFSSLSHAALGGLAVLLVAWLPLIVPLGTGIAWMAGPGAPSALTGWALGLAVTGSLAIIGAHILVVTQLFKVPLLYGVLMPLAFTMIAIITFDGVWQRARGRVEWKERAYPSPEKGA